MSHYEFEYDPTQSELDWAEVACDLESLLEWESDRSFFQPESEPEHDMPDSNAKATTLDRFLVGRLKEKSSRKTQQIVQRRQRRNLWKLCRKQRRTRK